MAHAQETQARPTLLSGCARASTAAEARYRISGREFTDRSSRVIALDPWAAAVIVDVAAGSWHGGHFLVFESALPDDALLRRAPLKTGGQNGTTALLSEELDGADTVIMVASARGSTAAASLIGDAAAARGIMSAGLVLAGPAPLEASPDRIVSALRPNAMVLVILGDTTDLGAVLAALRV
ncbi:MAG TPA: hypothetical protein VMU95_21685 [Trebonia sp.]|nr:hypothetical protein [Trebonia sp.]